MSFNINVPFNCHVSNHLIAIIEWWVLQSRVDKLTRTDGGDS